MAADQEPRGRRRWARPILQLVLVLALLVTAMGASGIFAFVLCPGCGSPMIYHPDPLPPTMPLPADMEKETKEAK